jgi:hypothetical protein
MNHSRYSFRIWASRGCSLFVSTVLLALLALPGASFAQEKEARQTVDSEKQFSKEPKFRIESIEVPNGGELLTLFVSGLQESSGPEASSEIPLVSVLRDTLGDDDPSNDKLKDVWVLTYTRPSTLQGIAAAIPFLYARAGNKGGVSSGPPPTFINLSNTERPVWNRFFWLILQSAAIDPYGLAVKASTRSLRQNISNYREGQLSRALTALSVYKNLAGGEEELTDREFDELRARILLDNKMFGGLVDESRLKKVAADSTIKQMDTRGHNWELLRQRAEHEGLYFDPLELPDRSATHALVWVSRSDLANTPPKRYSSRFLNISNPWNDDNLKRWNGYTQIWYFDAEKRRVTADTPGATPRTMIPLALYGLDDTKVPLILIDFRKSLNAKGREVSGRLINDVTRNILSLSPFGDLPYFAGRSAFNFVIGRRGIDFSQPSRVKSYAQLKFMLAFENFIEPGLKNEIASRIERVSSNPLQNDFESEARIAREQFSALVTYARDPKGLAARLDRERREEIAKLNESGKSHVFYQIANVASFGSYTHRAKPSPETIARLSLARSTNYYSRFLEDTLKASPRVEVTADITKVKEAVTYLLQHADAVDPRITRTTSQLFLQTDDRELKQLCLEGLSKMNSKNAEAELQRIYKDKGTDDEWKMVVSSYLRLPDNTSLRESSMLKSLSNIPGQ